MRPSVPRRAKVERCNALNDLSTSSSLRLFLGSFDLVFIGLSSAAFDPILLLRRRPFTGVSPGSLNAFVNKSRILACVLDDGVRFGAGGSLVSLCSSMSESCMEGAFDFAGRGVAAFETRAISERRRAAGVSVSGKASLDVLATGVCSGETSSGARRGVLELSSSSSPWTSTSSHATRSTMNVTAD